MKIAMLIPCLMTDNNREVNKKAMEYAKQYYSGIDEFVVNDQEFKPEDYLDGFTYIGHHDKRIGFVAARNQLLDWFYTSEYDYAVWMDANAKVSQSTLNDFITVVEAAKAGELKPDVVISTLGLMIYQERIFAKQMKDYFDNVHLVKFDADAGIGYHTMHCMFMSNFAKKYNMPVYIDYRCDPKQGTSEDTYFIRICKRLFNCRMCPTIIVTKPSNKTSTWVSDKKGYDYPPVDFKLLDKYISLTLETLKYTSKEQDDMNYTLIRKEPYKSQLQAYKPRTKIKGNLLSK